MGHVARLAQENDRSLLARDLPVQFRVTVEILLGRGLAFCAHPSAAWRRLPPAGRAMLVGAYAAGSYVSVLSILLLR